MLTVDVAVVGGGPAGAAAATRLARAGRDVLVIDRAAFPRDKCCGDGLTTAALRELEALGLDPVDVPSWQPVDGAWVRSPSGRTVTFPFPPDRGLFGAVARRVELDLALLDIARAAGAKVHDGHALRDARWSADGVTLTAAGMQPVAARYVIGADGVWSPLRKALHAEEATSYLGEWHAFRQYLAAPGPESRKLWVWFEPDLLPGYAWSFPLPNGTVNVGFGVRRRPGEATGKMAATWRSLLTRPHIAGVLGEGARAEAPHKAWPIPGGLTTLSAAGGRVLFVGDAARACDPMTGEGIGQALETARLAADAILAAGPSDPARVASSYGAAVGRGLRPDHVLANALSMGALTHRKAVRGAIRLAGASAWTRRNFARWLFEDYPRAVLATPWRWHRGMLTGPGAWNR